MPCTASLIRSVVAIFNPPTIVSCDSADPGLAEKIALMEAEIREKDRRIESMSSEISRSSAVPSAPATPNVEAATSSYLRYVDQLREKMAGAMPKLTFDSDRVSLASVVGPDPLLPITSTATFHFTTADGKRGELVVPLHADFSGNWKDPDIEAIVKAFQMPQSGPQTPAATNQTAVQNSTTQPKDVMGADRTIEVNWGDAPQQQPTPPPNQSQPSAPPSTPAQPQLPQRVMPTDRDVIIEF